MDPATAALIELHRGLDRQGPGDPAFSRAILSRLPAPPERPRIADLGCGAGAGALLLAEWYAAPVTGVDLARVFLDQLVARSRTLGLDHLIRAVEADMGRLDWPPASVDLLWSEGAAYNLTFAGALRTWRPLLPPGGVAVISELSWFTDAPPRPARDYWASAYPAIGTEPENAARATRAGFEVMGVHRLPAAAWWTHYYDPLARRIAEIRPAADSLLREAIRETETEMALFRDHDASYGYTFYVLKAA